MLFVFLNCKQTDGHTDGKKNGRTDLPIEIRAHLKTDLARRQIHLLDIEEPGFVSDGSVRSKRAFTRERPERSLFHHLIFVAL